MSKLYTKHHKETLTLFTITQTQIVLKPLIQFQNMSLHCAKSNKINILPFLLIPLKSENKHVFLLCHKMKYDLQNFCNEFFFNTFQVLIINKKTKFKENVKIVDIFKLKFEINNNYINFINVSKYISIKYILFILMFFL